VVDRADGVARPLAWRWLGRIAWDEAAALQEALRRQILDGDEAAERLLLCEHPPVVTLGRRAERANVLFSDEVLAARGVALARASRGGDVTFHGPGQLVAYPVLRLSRGVEAHVRDLAGAAVAVAAQLGVAASFERARPGVWVAGRKLAALGVHVHRRVAIHGLALNATIDPAAFEVIVPCGLAGVAVTSLAREAGRSPPPEALAAPFAAAFAARLGRPLEAA
jgi:lipoate-protein ligase B